MQEAIKTIIDGLNSHISPVLIVFIISMIPILELRGGLIAAAILGVDWAVAFPVCVLGNMLPIPFILLFIRKILDWLKRFKSFKKLTDWIDRKAEKGSKKLQNVEMWGLILFVGIPLPGTGGWTGALVANALNMKIKKSFPCIFVGVIMAGLIISLLAYLIPGYLF